MKNCLFIVLFAMIHVASAGPLKNPEATPKTSDRAYSNMQRSIGGIVEQVAKSRGFSTADPRSYGTLYGMGKAAVGTAAGVGAGVLVVGRALLHKSVAGQVE
jgi:hypothetical protein